MTKSTHRIAAIAVDYLNVDSLLAAEQLEPRDRVGAFADVRIWPNFNACYEAGRFPRELARESG